MAPLSFSFSFYLVIQRWIVLCDRSIPWWSRFFFEKEMIQIGFYWVLPGFTRFYLLLPSFTGFYWVLLGLTRFDLLLPSFTGFDWVWLGFTGFNKVRPTSTEFYGVFTRFNVVLQGFTGFDWVWLGLTGFDWVWLGLTGFDWVWLGLTGFDWVFLGGSPASRWLRRKEATQSGRHDLCEPAWCSGVPQKSCHHRPLHGVEPRTSSLPTTARLRCRPPPQKKKKKITKEHGQTIDRIAAAFYDHYIIRNGNKNNVPPQQGT